MRSQCFFAAVLLSGLMGGIAGGLRWRCRRPCRCWEGGSRRLHEMTALSSSPASRCTDRFECAPGLLEGHQRPRRRQTAWSLLELARCAVRTPPTPRAGGAYARCAAAWAARCFSAAAAHPSRSLPLPAGVQLPTALLFCPQSAGSRSIRIPFDSMPVHSISNTQDGKFTVSCLPS